MREHLDSIRRSEGRPIVALVLSGGGAKGAAHVGVKKLMDELQIPVDLICGTSMGGLMGGLMSMGYSCDYIDSLLRHQDWDITLSDKVHPKYIPFEVKEYKSKYLISIPFHYSKDVFRQRFVEDGKPESDINTRKGVRNLSSSLPSGYVYGFNVGNLLSSFSVGYQDSISFRDLPIPFFCVSADLVSLKAKNWGSGSVKTAMRSTMSIPGMFDPVRTEGMILVDGGVRNNFPVDLARAMGADIVVGVELSDRHPTYNELNNIGDIMSRFITMLGKDAFELNRGDCDIFVKPDLDGFGMLSFSPAAVDTIINRGYRAACEKIDEFSELKRAVGPSAPYLGAPCAVDINNTPVRVGNIRFEGLEDKESRLLQRKVGLKAGQMVDAKTMNDAMSKVQATGCFESVSYSLLGHDAPYELVFDCVKGPSHQLGLGIRADSEEWVSLLLNLGVNTHRLMGSKFDFDLKLGKSLYFNAHYMLDLDKWPTLNLEFLASHTSPDVWSEDNTLSNFSLARHRERIYVSNINWTALNFKAGIQNQFDYLYDFWRQESSTGNFPEGNRKGGYGSLFASGGLYTLDSKYYPSRGTDLSFRYEYTLSKAGDSWFSSIQSISFNLMHVFRIGSRFAIIPDLHLRALVDHNEERYTYLMDNFVGGEIAGRYLEQQMPMTGVSGMYNARDHAAVLNLALRYKFLKNLYVSAKGSYLHDGSTLLDFVSSLEPTFTTGALEVGYNSILGPIRAEVYWSGLTRSVGGYLSLGFDF